MEGLTIIPFPHGLSDHVGRWGDVLEEQMECLMCALPRRDINDTKILQVDYLWLSTKND